MKKYISLIALVAFVAFGSLALAKDTQTSSNEDSGRVSLTVRQNGMVSLRGAKVTSVGTNTLNASLTWGSLVMSWTINVNDKTHFTRTEGGKSSLAETAVGQMINVDGSVDTTATTPTLVARMIRNLSVRKAHSEGWGSIKSIDAAGNKFTADLRDKGEVIVSVSTTTKITKNHSVITFADLKIGDQVQLSGLWDKDAKTFQADTIAVRLQNKTVFDNGTLKTSSSATPPTSITITFKGIDYTVNIATNTALLKANWTKASLADFTVGDRMRVSGSVSGSTIDATTVRDLKLK